MEIIKLVIMINEIKTGRKVVVYLLLFVTFLLFADKTFSQKAVSFRSPGDFIEVPNSLSLAPTEFTIEFWLKVRELGDPNAAGGEQTILDKRGSGETGYNLRLAGTKFPIPFFAFVLPGGVNTYDVINRNLWYHIAVTQDQDSLKTYFNGELAGRDANFYASNTNAPLRIGEFLGYPGAYLGLRGDIDELRIWNTARSQDEVQSAMHEKLIGSEAGLAAYWDFDSQSGIIINDLSQNGNDGTLNGNATLVDSDAPIGFIPPTTPVGLRVYGGTQSVDLTWKPGGDNISA
ncbi:MAG: LamG domain-containing protein, partial [Cyclobacteriaceae bacterium]|nr:LamG domain-containing protein [Cyclobacteriaceae bacterium]